MSRPTTPHEQNDAGRDEDGLIDDLVAPLRRDARGRTQRHRDHADRIDDRKRGRKCGSDEPNVHAATTGYRLLKANVKPPT